MSGTPSVMASTMRIFDLSLGQMLWSRRSVFLGVLLGGPVLLAVVLRVVDTLRASGFKIKGAAAGGRRDRAGWPFNPNPTASLRHAPG